VHEKQKHARGVVVCYIGTTMYAWRHRDYIMTPYNFE
jgi:hypothetical protein